MTTMFTAALLRASLFLVLTALIVLVATRRLRSPVSVRVLWVFVLLQGLVWLRFDVPLGRPVEAAEPDPLAFVDDPANDLLFDADWESSPWAQPAAPVESAAPVWSAVCLGAWLIGVVLLLLLHAGAYLRFLSCVQPRPGDAEWQDEWDAVQFEAGRRKSIPAFAADVAGPMLCWWYTHYRLLLPRDCWSTLDAEQRLAILHHECAHLIRHDPWKSLVARLLALPQWFNPLAWLAVRRFDENAEWACDEVARSRMPESMPAYARALLALGRARTSQSTPSLVSAASGRRLVERIQRVLTPPCKETGMKLRLCLVAAAVACATIVNGIRVVSAAAPQTTQKDGISLTNLTGTLTPAPKPPAPTADKINTFLKVANHASPDEAVVDMQELFRVHPEFQDAMKQLKREVMDHEDELRAKIRKAHEQGDLDLADANDPFARQQTAQSIAALKKKLMARESQLYLDTFRDIQREIAAYARSNGIRIVRRIRTQPIKREDSKLEKDPRRVLELINRPIVFNENEPQDITVEIARRLNRKDKSLEPKPVKATRR